MEVELSDLKETKKNLKDLEPYPKEKPMGFEDTDKRFMVVVMVEGELMKKHIPSKYTKLDVNDSFKLNMRMV